ncbi:hypothetical protein [Ralstonia solanacearum]|uniref:hypothetical protein n=1 Tax=Ralstonia solanacearum TaxID=305 RepID=UPI0005AC88F6|nr:hypothetical protein [Ralstonia solanacearum]
MARPSVIPAVRERLEAYLNEREAEYLARPENARHVTIPATADGKVNVRALAIAIGLKTTQEKYLYEREELSQLINLMAEGQGLAPIGARLLQTAADKALKEKIVRQAQNAKLAEQAAVEAQAAQSELLEQLQSLAADNERLRAHNVRLQAQIDAMHAGVFIRVDE